VQPNCMAASAELFSPTVTSGHVVVVPPGPAAGPGFPYEFPFELAGGGASLGASASLRAPVIGGMPVDVPVDDVMTADAEMLPPTIVVTAPVVEVPAFDSAAGLHAPSVSIAESILVPCMGA